MSERKVQVAVSSQVTEGALLTVSVDGMSVLLSRIGGKVYAVVNRCPHMGMKMSRGKICDGVVKCPWHGSRFDFCSGANVDWVDSFAGIPMPRWTHKIIAMGKAPAGLMTVPAEETEDEIFVSVSAPS